jgi:cyclopropane-fatty-acyl-phospholipid synthase
MSVTAATVSHPGQRAPAPPRAGVRAAVARRLFERAVARLPLTVVAPGGARSHAGPPGAPVMRIHRDAFFHRLGAAGRIGFAEAYMAGDWTADDLAGVLTAFASRLSALVPRPLAGLRGLYEPRLPTADRNTIAGAAANIRRHYDLSNDLFALFLDPTMTYSCAIFEPGDSLADAQLRKLEAVCAMLELGPDEAQEHRLERVCRALELGPDDHLLEIGSGWGSLAIHAATTRGCRVTTATISPEQLELARRRVAMAGLDDRVEVILRDYRELRGRYSKLASVEMFEAVGEQYWPAFFATCDRLLAPGGRMALQTITMPHARYRTTRRTYGWIHKYVFPGGLIPSLEAIDGACRTTALRVRERVEIGRHYAPTLRAWRERFLAQRERVRDLGFTAEFVRMWELYLAYCEAGFATGALGDAQLLLARDAA